MFVRVKGKRARSFVLEKSTGRNIAAFARGNKAAASYVPETTKEWSIVGVIVAEFVVVITAVVVKSRSFARVEAGRAVEFDQSVVKEARCQSPQQNRKDCDSG